MTLVNSLVTKQCRFNKITFLSHCEQLSLACERTVRTFFHSGTLRLGHPDSRTRIFFRMAEASVIRKKAEISRKQPEFHELNNFITSDPMQGWYSIAIESTQYNY
jgi:hypothetical protein